MYYRRKILLAIIESFGNPLEKIRLQKLLFLFCQKQHEPSFHFVPFKFGCYSFQANADLSALIKYKIVTETEDGWMKIDTVNYCNQLTASDRYLLSSIRSTFSCFSNDELVKHTYLQFPYYAIKSSIAQTLLDNEQISKMTQHIPRNNESILFTIGYEGISFEEYLNKLIRNDIKVLCDVRNNPISMKYGFSKSQLEKTCNALGIKYFHLPNLGITSEKRKNLETQSDYDQIFEEYKNEVLCKNAQDQLKIIELLREYERVALTCFESDIHKCHRFHLSASLEQSDNWTYKTIHI